MPRDDEEVKNDEPLLLFFWATELPLHHDGVFNNGIIFCEKEPEFLAPRCSRAIAALISSLTRSARLLMMFLLCVQCLVQGLLKGMGNQLP